MVAVKGYFDGNVCVINDNISMQPQDVIITFLDKADNRSAKLQKNKKKRIQALRQIQKLWKKHPKQINQQYDEAIDKAFGLWEYHDNSISVDEYVRNLRKGRKFDI